MNSPLHVKKLGIGNIKPLKIGNYTVPFMNDIITIYRAEEEDQCRKVTDLLHFMARGQ
jgi:hypothetical protein